MKDQKLTQHQKRILGAMLLMAHESPTAWFGRWDIGSRATATMGNCKTNTMLSLMAMGLVRTMSQDRLDAVLSQECRCGCDRWQLTDEGFRVANTFRLTGHTAGPRGYRPLPGKNQILGALGMEPEGDDPPEPKGDWNIDEQLVTEQPR